MVGGEGFEIYGIIRNFRDRPVVYDRFDFTLTSHIRVARRSSSSTCSLINAFNTFRRSSRSPPTKFVPLSDRISSGCPRLPT